MKKNIFVAMAAMVSSFFLPGSATAQPLVCWELSHSILGVSSFVYKLSVQDLGNGNYLLAGSSLATMVTNPPQTVRRVVTGGATVISDNELEVSLRTTDIHDRATTATEESLATSDVHLLLDNTLNGTFHTVNVYYPRASDTTSEPSVSSSEGTVTLVNCN